MALESREKSAKTCRNEKRKGFSSSSHQRRPSPNLLVQTLGARSPAEPPPCSSSERGPYSPSAARTVRFRDFDCSFNSSSSLQTAINPSKSSRADNPFRSLSTHPIFVSPCFIRSAREGAEGAPSVSSSSKSSFLLLFVFSLSPSSSPARIQSALPILLPLFAQHGFRRNTGCTRVSAAL